MKDKVLEQVAELRNQYRNNWVSVMVGAGALDLPGCCRCGVGAGICASYEEVLSFA